MKGLIHWFKSSSKMKRWMFLILVGIMCVCYGIAEILVMDEMSFENAGVIIAVFAVGFVAIILGLIFLNKRAMEVVIESTDDRMKDRKNINVKSLIFDKTVYNERPKIVAISGGTGLDTVIEGLKEYTNNITAIVPISAYGEEASESRQKLNTLPLEDMKESMVSLAFDKNEMSRLLNYKFIDGKLRGIEFSDIFFEAMRCSHNGDFTQAIMDSSKILNISGKVIPATLDEIKIVAELANGYTVEEKSRIPEVVVDKFTKINRVRLIPSNCKPAPGVIEAIKEADCIVIGPGSLYTNVIPCLLVNGVAKAIKESKAIKIYVSNIMTEIGQTDEYSVADHINAIREHCRQNIIDFCIYDTGEIIPEFIKKYNMGGQDLVSHDTSVKGVKFIQRDLSAIAQNEFIRHDPKLVASAIIELVCDDLKYQDKQSDPQYIMLNNKLREEKRINKTKKENEKRIMKNRKHGKRESTTAVKGKSKFSTKYKDRIASIREADKSKLTKEKQEKKAREVAKRLEQEMKKSIENQKRYVSKTKNTKAENLPKKEGK